MFSKVAAATYLPTSRGATVLAVCTGAHTPPRRHLGDPQPSDQPRGLAVSDPGLGCPARLLNWSLPGRPLHPCDLPSSESPRGTRLRFSFLPAGSVWLFVTASAVSLSARFQLLLSEICSDADVCVFVGRGEFWLEVSYYAIHPETLLINKIFFFKLVEKNLNFLRIMSVLNKFRETKIKLFCRYN